MRFFSWVVLFISISAFSQNGSLNSPSAYNNFIVQEQNNLVKMIIDFNLANLYNTNSANQNSQKEEILKQIEISINKINAAGDYHGDNKLKNEALQVFKSYQSIFDIEFNEINSLRAQRENSIEAMEKYLLAVDQAEQKLKNGGDRFLKAQKEFAQKNNLSIQSTTSSSDLNNFFKLTKYSRYIFLEYFRVSMNDNNFLTALNEQQTELMEAQRLKIIASTDKALININKLSSIPEDTSYKASAIQLIQFHKRLAENEYQELIVIIKNPNRSQKDIDRFNEVVIIVNDQTQALLNKFNQLNKELLRKNIPGN